MSITVDQATDDRMIPTPPRTDGDIIREARLDLGKTQDWLTAELVRAGYRDGKTLARNYVSMIETGRPVPLLMRTYLNQILGIDLPRRPR